MVICTRRDASAWVAYWISETGSVRSGILKAVVAGLRKSLSIMDGSPARYTFADREDLREAIAYLTETDWSARPVKFSPVS